MQEIDGLPNLSALSIEESKNEKLDLVVTLLVESYEKLLSERKLLDECLNDGYLNLSKARSQLGCANLSLMQIPAEDHNLKPFVTIEVTNTKKAVTSNETKDVNIEFSSMTYDLMYDQDESNSKGTEKKEAKDNLAPQIKWFSAFPPLSLRQCQKSFSKSIVIIKNICDLQAKLKVLNDLYNSLTNELKNSNEN